MAVAHPQLPLPGDVAHCLRQRLEPIKHLPADARLHPVTPRSLDQGASGEAASGLGDAAAAHARAAGMFGRREAKIRHQLSWIVKAMEVPDLRQACVTPHIAQKS
tara:strand:- start:344 stop:658 length:315 start_codon:yes stop_codon:yes gene_type:complete